MSLTARGEARAARRSIYVVWYVFDAEDDAGNDITWGMPLVIHRFRWLAKLDAMLSTSQPVPQGAAPGGRYIVDGPVNLLAFTSAGFCTEANLRTSLGWSVGTPITQPRRWYHPSRYTQSIKSAPLTAEEAKQAAQTMVWTVYYEDRFHVGDARESFPVAICLTKEEAESELARRGKPAQSGSDGYSIAGPSPLQREGAGYSEFGADAVREALNRVASGKSGSIPIG